MTVAVVMLTYAMLRCWLAVTAMAASSVTVACGRTNAAQASGDVAMAPDSSLSRAMAQDSVLRAADAAIRAGHPWRATLRLTPALRDPKRRTPAVVLLAARAAAGWDGWTEVERLLSGQSWVDSRFNGEPRELLARAALEHGDDTAAAANARAALARASDQRARAMRHTLLARALDRANLIDSARSEYLAAAAGLADVKDWLLLRAAGVDRDSTDRARLFADIRLAAARPRIPWTEAQALERSGDIAGAATRYAALGANVSALRLRLSLPSDEPTRNTLRAQAVAFVRTHSGTGDARQAVELLDKYFTPLTAGEELIVARSAAASGPLARALAAYGRAVSGGTMSADDLLAYGEQLVRAGRNQDAIAQLDAIPATSPVAGRAAYQRARALLAAGRRDDATSQLQDVASRFPSDTTAAVSAMYLLADLESDDNRDADARTELETLAAKYPASSRADDALFRAGVISYALRDYPRAAKELDSVTTRYPGSNEFEAARYWSGRAWAAAGETATARTRWREVGRRDSASYYAAAAARRLGEPIWAPSERAGGAHSGAALAGALRRITLLEQLGMDTEARFEADALERDAGSSVDRLLATAAAFRDNGEPARAARLAERALKRGAPGDASTYRLVFPLMDRDALIQQAAAHGLDPALVAGIIRQESSFNRHAVSVAGARGLMQVLPSVGQEVAHNLGFPVWDPALLFDADANLQIGTAHLVGSVKQFGTLVRVLAAYNAGPARAVRWSARTGVDDPELFAERIPFTETRDYVRIVQRNAEMYRALYSDLK